MLTDEKDDQADDGIVNEDGGDPDALIEELANVAFQNARRPAILLDREHPGQQRPDDAADRMYAETIQRIVIAEDALQARCIPNSRRHPRQFRSQRRRRARRNRTPA